MKFYFNENYLIKYKNDKLRIIFKEIKEIYDCLNKRNYKLCIKDNLDIDMNTIYKDRNLALVVAPFLKHIEQDNINTNISYNFIDLNSISPKIEDDKYYIIELLSLCYRDSNELVVSLKNEDEFNHGEYSISKESNELKIINIIGRDKLEEYCRYNPAPKNAKEVFEKAQNEFNHIKFTKKAFETVESRNDIIKQYGFNKLFNVFKALEELVYPFFKGDTRCSHSYVIKLFKKTTSLDYSDESDLTMNKYGYQRKVTINGKEVQMRYHIKIKNDVRIYFKYIKEDDCIYIGHSGKHLDTAK